MEYTVETYRTLGHPELPFTHSTEGHTLQNFSIACARCGEHITGDMMRGEVTQHARCIEIEAGVGCIECQLVTFSRARYYKGRFLKWTNDGIVEHKMVAVRDWRWALRKLKGLFITTTAGRGKR